MSISFRCPFSPTLPMFLGASALALLAGCSGSSSKSAPSITSQPTSVTTVVGRTVKFEAKASGNPAPSLVWQKDGVDITSQRSTTCKVEAPKLSDAGDYTLYASNSRGSATSKAATLTVLAVPTLVAPFGVAVDSDSNLYVSDSNRHVIYKITYSGSTYTRSVLAGSEGTQGHADATTGTDASFDTPQGLALDDSAGFLYVADYGNHTIRKINVNSGAVATLAGTPETPGITDSATGSPQFNHPVGLAMANGNLYVADSGNHTIRKIVLSTATVSTFAGTAGSPGSTDGASGLFSSPNGVAADSLGNVYVADYGNSTIRGITSGGVVSSLAGYAGETGTANGTGTGARFNQPVSIVLDASGNLLVADTYNHAIRKVTLAKVVTTLAGERSVAGNEDEAGVAAHFNTPTSLCVDGSGNAFVADFKNGLIRRVTSSGAVATVTSTGVIATDPYDD